MNEAPRNINDLPREIMETIFNIHVNWHYDWRHTLLLTSRTWHTIATTYPALWKSIAFRCETDLAPEVVLCSDLQSLALAVNRTCGAQFELYLGETFTKLKIKELKAFINSVDKEWLSRCRALTIFPQAGKGPVAKTMGDVFFSGGLNSLEALYIKHKDGRRRWEPFLQRLMEKVDSSALGFKTLRVRVMGLPEKDGTAWITRHIYKWPNILGRLTEVTLRDTCEPIPWQYFTKVQKIEVWCNDEMNPLVKLDIPVVQHLTLGGIDNPNHSLSLGIWNQLTHLTIKDSVDEFGPFTLCLPSLISLGLIICGFSLHHIEAPKLDELIVRLDGSDDTNDVYRELFDGALFTPRVIHIDVQDTMGTDFPEEALGIFATKLPLWSKVEELHLRHLGEIRYIEDVIIDALSDESSDQYYPKLHSLTVFFPMLELDELDDNSDEAKAALKRSVTRKIIGIGKKRATCKEGGMTKLEVGWYVEYGDDYVESEWRVVDWKDCLRIQDEEEDEDDDGGYDWYIMPH